MVDMDKLLVAIQELSANVKDEVKEMISLKAEIKATRKVELENKKFMEKLCMSLIANQQKQEMTKTAMLKEVVSWILKIGAIVVLAAIGLKTFIPSFL